MIYLDYAATAPVRPEIAQLAHERLSEPLGNPSSLHRAGRRARILMEQAREKCAELLHAKVEEIIFCSGATEADNLAILGTLTHGDCRHLSLVSSLTEHAAVYETVHRQEMLGLEVDWLAVSETGTVNLEDLHRRLRRGPAALVSVMVVNNEIGTRQPVFEIGKLCREYGALFHADGVQDPHTARELIKSKTVDLVSLSGHKMGGLHGGVLYVRQGIALNPQVVGGAQEDGRRAGTSEHLRAESFVLALQATLSEDPRRYWEFQQVMKDRLGNLESAVGLGPEDPEQKAGHISSWVFGGLPAEPLLVQLDMKGICASSGSACSSHSVEPSRVVKAMGYSEEQARGLIRFSFGWQTGRDEVVQAADAMQEIAQRLMQKERKVR